MRLFRWSWLPIGCILYLGSTLYLFPNQPVHSNAPRDLGTVRTLRKNIEAADAVILGQVIDIQYRMSAPTSRSESLPYTFVTYRVEKTLGEANLPEKLTLRFLGGPDQQGNFLQVSGSPVFQEGQQDLLFIRNNGEADCPLVRCNFGRYRVFQGRMYDHFGVPVVGIKDDVIQVQGLPEMALMRYDVPRPSFEELLKNPDVQEQVKKLAPDGNLKALKERYEREAPKTVTFSMKGHQGGTGDRSGADTTPEQSRVPVQQILPLSQFQETVRSRVQKLQWRGRPVVSLDPNQRFVSRQPVLAKPNLNQPEVQTPDRPETELDKRERLLLEKQAFDPVIKQRPPLRTPQINPEILRPNPPLRRIPNPSLEDIR